MSGEGMGAEAGEWEANPEGEQTMIERLYEIPCEIITYIVELFETPRFWQYASSFVLILAIITVIDYFCPYF
jgi:hypothetical protein